MQHRAPRFWGTRQRLGLLVVASLALGLLAPIWLSAQGNGVLGGLAPNVPASSNAASGASASPGSGPVTARVYLPLVTLKAPAPPPFFGVAVNKVNNANGLAQAVAADVHWIRFSAFRWNEIEPVRTTPPTYNWAEVDEASLLKAQENGLQVIAIVHYTPTWAQKYPGSACGPIKEGSLDAFAQFLTALVKRYSAPPFEVRYWEVWNEQDTAVKYEGQDDLGFGCWGDASDPYYGGGYFAEMLKKAYPAIKAADPQAQVLLGGLLLDCDPRNPPAGKDCSPSNFLEGILRNGGGNCFDIVNYHAYTYYVGGATPIQNANWPGSITAVPEKTEFLRQVLGQYGYANKPFINTEAALACYAATSDCLEAQAMYIPRVYAEALALGLKAQVYYAMVNEAWFHTGLLLPNLSPKPAYNAFKTASSFLEAAKYEGPAAGYRAVIQGYSFRRGNTTQHLDVIWSRDGSNRNVTLPAGASAYDRYGTLIASSGVIQVGLSPVYIVRP
jgi:hypothetical protein